MTLNIPAHLTNASLSKNFHLPLLFRFRSKVELELHLELNPSGWYASNQGKILIPTRENY